MAEQTEEERDAYLRSLGYPGYNQPHPHDRSRADTTTEHPAGVLARRRLDAAVADLDLTEEEMRTLRWLMRWEPRTLENVASMIEKARAAAGVACLHCGGTIETDSKSGAPWTWTHVGKWQGRRCPNGLTGAIPKP